MDKTEKLAIAKDILSDRYNLNLDEMWVQYWHAAPFGCDIQKYTDAFWEEIDGLLEGTIGVSAIFIDGCSCYQLQKQFDRKLV